MIGRSLCLAAFLICGQAHAQEIAQPGGSGPISGQSFSENFDAIAYCPGVKGDGVTDDSTALNACIAMIGSNFKGGTLFLDAGHTFAIASTLDNQGYANICLKGFGTDTLHSVGTQGANASSILKWIGASGTTNDMVWWHTPDGNDNGIKLSGGCVHGIYFDSGKTTANTGAGRGLHISSWVNGDFSNNYFNEMQSAGILADVVTHLFDARDTQRNNFDNDACSNYAASNNNAAGDCVQFVGDASAPSGSHGTGTAANVSANNVHNLYCAYQNGVCLHMFDTDHNHIYSVLSNMLAGGTGSSVVLEGSNSGTSFTARKNDITGISGGVILARGTASYTFPSVNNILNNVDTGNGTSVSAETGATLSCDRDTAGNFGACSQPLLPSCAANTVSLSTFTVTNGIVTHC